MVVQGPSHYLGSIVCPSVGAEGTSIVNRPICAVLGCRVLLILRWDLLMHSFLWILLTSFCVAFSSLFGSPIIAGLIEEALALASASR